MKLLATLFMAATLAPVAVFAQAPAAAPVMQRDLAAGEAKYTAICASCHGADGNSAVPAQPKLARQHPEYLVKQLQEFKNGKRKDGPAAVMVPFAMQLTDADMVNIAGWLASQKNKTGFAKDAKLMAEGEKIWRGGIADRNIAACAACHGANGAGLPAQYPRLGGQHADYTDTQLKAFRDGVRKNNAVMSQVAAKMNDREIKAVSDYVAGLR